MTDLSDHLLFLENLILLDKMKNGCPVPRKIVVHSASIELELLVIQDDEGLRQFKLSGCSITQFWTHMHEQKCPKIRECAKRRISIFGTTYSCESLYSTLKFIKSKHWAVLSDKHLSVLVRTSLSSHQWDFKQLIAQMDTWKSAM